MNRKNHNTDQCVCVNTATSVSGYQEITKSTTINEIVINMKIIDFVNHAVQCNQFDKPIIFIASFSCFSFSFVMNYKKTPECKLYYFSDENIVITITYFNGIDTGINKTK